MSFYWFINHYYDLINLLWALLWLTTSNVAETGAQPFQSDWWVLRCNWKYYLRLRKGGTCSPLKLKLQCFEFASGSLLITYTTMDLFLHFRHITITYLEGIEQTISQSIKTPQCFNSFEVQTNSPKAYAKKRWKNK